MVSSRFEYIPDGFGKVGSYSFFRNSLKSDKCMILPENDSLRPHENALEWHRKHIFYS
jgi:hypothetical protein